MAFSPTPATHQNILVVEDDAATRDLLKQYLGDGGLHVTSAAMAADAERLLADEVVDLVVLDPNLPDGDESHQRTASTSAWRT